MNLNKALEESDIKDYLIEHKITGQNENMNCDAVAQELYAAYLKKFIIIFLSFYEYKSLLIFERINLKLIIYLF